MKQVNATARTPGASRRRKQGQDEMLQRLNEVYRDANPAEKTLLKGAKAKFGRTAKDRW
jgi:hypothetical protein